MTPEPPNGLDWLRAFDAEVQRALPLAESARYIVCAHAAFESGWGTSYAMRHALNAFNLTAGPYWHGQVVVQANGDTEYTADGKFVGHITQTWRCYPTIQDCLEDYWVFIGWPRYVAGRDALERGDLASFVHYLGPSAPRGMGGFFTLPEKQYLAGMQAALLRVTGALRVSDPNATPPGIS